MRLRRAYAVTFSIASLALICGCGGGAGASDDTGANTLPREEVAPAAPVAGAPMADAPAAPAPVPVPTPATDSLRAPLVPLYRVFEQSVTNTNAYANKFTDVALNVEYTSPSGRQMHLPGFYDGDGQGGQSGNVWKYRFMPTEAGTWSFSYSWSDGKPGGSGTFEAIATGAGRGVLRPYSGNPRWFAYEGKEPVFLKSYYVGAGGLAGVPIDWAAPNVYQKLVDRGYNHVQLNMLPLGWTNQKPSDAPAHNSKPLWRDTPKVQNLDVWKRMEQHVAWLNDRDVAIHFFMGLDPKPSGTPDAFFALQRFTGMSSADQEFYIRYLAARLAPYANLAGWNYTWETDGSTGERRMMQLLAQYDPWSHLGTYHDEAPQGNIYDSAEFGFAGIENHGYFGNSGGNPARDSASHYQSTMDAYRGKPVYMVEGNGLWRACWAQTEAERSITRAAWAVTLAGGSFTWQDTPDCDFQDAASSIFTWPAGNPMADRLDALYTTLTRDVSFHSMQPHNDLLGGCWSSFNRAGAVPTSPCFALAEVGKQYLAYKEDGGTFSLQLAGGSYSATWIDTRSGTRQGGGSVTGGSVVSFTAPSTSTDWVLLLKAG